MPKHSELVRVVYDTPSGDIDRRVEIGWGSISTLPTEKVGLGFPVGFVRISALRTLPAAVAGVNKAEWDTSQNRLVGGKLPQLSEGPVTQAPSLFSSNCFLGAGSDVGQVFQRQSYTECLCGSNEGFTDPVIDPGLKAPLPTGHLSQSAPCSPCVASLELFPRLCGKR